MNIEQASRFPNLRVITAAYLLAGLPGEQQLNSNRWPPIVTHFVDLIKEKTGADWMQMPSGRSWGGAPLPNTSRDSITQSEFQALLSEFGATKAREQTPKFQAAPAQTPATSAPVVTEGASDLQYSENNEPPLDFISFDQAYEILHRRLSATNVELAMWIFVDDLQAWTFNSFENCFLPFSYPVDGTHAKTPESAVTLLHKKEVKFSQSEIDSFDPDKQDKNYPDYRPGRFISYLEAKARIDSAAKAYPTLNLDGVHEEWRRLHKAISCGELGVEVKVVGWMPGAYALDAEKLEKLKNEHKETEIEAEIQKSLERGLFRDSEIVKFIKRYIEQASPAPEQSPTTPAPVVAVGAPGGVEPGMHAPTVKVPTHGNSTKIQRSDSIDPVIKLAQAECSDPKDTNQVWPRMQVLAQNEHPPFLASMPQGLKYHKAGTAAYFTRNALDKRLHPDKRGTPGKRR